MILSPSTLGALCAFTAVLFFSVNDTTIKFLSSDYALHQIVLIRAGLGLVITMAFIAPFSGGWAVFRTKRLRAHLVRGTFTVLANITFYLGLAAMPMAQATAIFFISPILITVFSVVFLKETVGPWRWAAVAVGFLGVLIIVRPGAAAFQVAVILPILAAVCYAAFHTMTRRMGSTESAATMSVFTQITFIVVCVVIGLAVGDGRFGDQSDASLAFLLRGWHWPEPADYPLFAIIGLGVACASYLISQAYRQAPPAFVAPFEYVAMPLAVFWGWAVFDEWPSAVTFVGIALIMAAGIITIWRESVNARLARRPKTRR